MKNNKIDVHGCDLPTAILLIKKAINESYKLKLSSLKVIHGFNNGEKIKKWCINEGYKLENVSLIESGENEGITVFYLKLNLKG